MINSARLEQGNIRYELYIDADNKNRMVTIEYWKNEGALEKHKQTKIFLDFLKPLEIYLVAPMNFVQYEK